MGDRELLEAAAKAAGFGSEDGCTTWTESEYPPKSGQHGALWNFVGWGETAELWNPLTDDGDALRLAVKLLLTVETCATYAGATEPSDGKQFRVFASEVDDPYAATRRAIVRAAAAQAASTPAPQASEGDAHDR